MLSDTPLDGITVVEFGHSVAAPFAGMILAELGAEVIKVENPATRGDYARDWGPPFENGIACTFHAINRGKVSVTADLRDPRQAAALKAMIADRADVFLHNFKPGAMERHGFGSKDILEKKPSLIYCNISAFGAHGPLQMRPAYDPLIQAFSGLMSIQGNEGDATSRISVSIVDIGTGLWAAIAILAALRDVDRSGRGGVIDTSLFETSLSWLGIPIAQYLRTGQRPKRAGSGSSGVAPYQVFATEDGELLIAAGNDALFRRLVESIDLADLSDRPEFATNAARVSNKHELINRLQSRLRTKSKAHWMALLEAAGVPCSPVQSLDEVLHHEQTAALGIVQEMPGGTARTVGLPVSFDNARRNFKRPAPQLGQDTETILGPYLRASSSKSDPKP